MPLFGKSAQPAPACNRLAKVARECPSRWFSARRHGPSRPIEDSTKNGWQSRAAPITRLRSVPKSVPLLLAATLATLTQLTGFAAPVQANRLTDTTPPLARGIDTARPAAEQAVALRDIDGNRYPLRQLVDDNGTLLLIVRESEELPEAFRLLTLAESQHRHCLIAIVEPAGRPFANAALKRAARPFLDSEFSRQRILFAANPPFGEARAALVAPSSTTPSWQSPTYPLDQDFENPPLAP